MGKLGYFLGGALLGAAGLTAAAFLTRDKDAEESAKPKIDFTQGPTWSRQFLSASLVDTAHCFNL